MGYCSRSGYQKSLDAQVPYVKWQYNNEYCQPSVSTFGICGFNPPCISFKVGAKLRAMANTLYSLSWSFILQIFSWISPSEVTFSVRMMHLAPSVHWMTSPFSTALRSPLSALFHFPIALSSSNIQSLSRFITSHFQYLLLIICYILHPRLMLRSNRARIFFPTDVSKLPNTVQGTKGTQFILVK